LNLDQSWEILAIRLWMGLETTPARAK